MPGIAFSPNILSHVDVSTNHVEADSVRDALEEVFARHPKLRSYLFDDDGSVRKHIAVIVNGEPVKDRNELSDPVSDIDEIFLMQALSGG
ncbi:MAG: MoaD/ThiS family protein [Verrucomicrobiales bacterium]|nr:MoaD/ThiS family protein [Verrucomicrobiales bacterium]